MKFTKKRGYEGTIRKVWTNDKVFCYGAIGTVGDFLDEGILEYAAYDRDTWCFLPAPGLETQFRICFRPSRSEVLSHVFQGMG